MSRMYLRIRSRIKKQWVSAALTLAVFLSLSAMGWALDPAALPTGGKITAGSGSIATTGSQMTVNQSTQQMIANWDTFNIGRNAGVSFIQPNSSATALNRIYDQNPSQIFGSLSSNGRVFLLNPSGIVFGQNARVDVGGLVASSLNLTDSDFLAGKYQFNNIGVAGSVINRGVINAMPGGVVALIAPKVFNEGNISADGGSVLMAAGNQVSLDFQGDGLIRYTVDQGAVDALAENKGLIKADGGLVVMTAKAANQLTHAVVNNSGILEAKTLQEQKDGILRPADDRLFQSVVDDNGLFQVRAWHSRSGRILLLSDMEYGETIVGGRLDASAPNGGDGGFIETSAAKVTVRDGIQVTTNAPNGQTGTWLIDPNDFTIASDKTGTVTGGTPSGDISGATLSTALGASNVTILSSQGSTVDGSGDINVNDAVSWNANLLTLTAARDININAVMTASGTSTLTMNTATDNGGDAAVSDGTVKVGFNPDGTFKGRVDFFEADGTTPRSGTGFLIINGAGYTVINDVNTLQAMGSGLSAVRYALGSNIDASATSGWNSGAGFTPIGTQFSLFAGAFDGLGHTINNLTINRPGSDYQGLFGYTNGPSLRNVGLNNVSLIGNRMVGGLVGYNLSSSITNTYVTGSVSSRGGSSNSTNATGGLVGGNNVGTIANSYTDVTVTVTADWTYAGGLVGHNSSGIITNSYTTGSTVTVSGYSYNNSIGGLVGVSQGAITDSYAADSTVTVSAGYNYYIGGLIGRNVGDGTVTNSHYNVDDVLINGARHVTPYGLYGAQFTDWLGHDKSLAISDYATLPLNGGYYEISSAQGLKDLLGFAEVPAYKFRLTADLDLANIQDASGTTSDWRIPIFSASEFDGGGHTLTNLNVNQPFCDYIGFIGILAAGGTLKNIGLTNFNVDGTGHYQVGGLVGSNSGTVANSYATGMAKGYYYVGGLVGQNSGGSITSSYAAGTVEGQLYAGGLVGYSSGGTITDSYVTSSSVTGSGSYENIGGLVGSGYNSGIINSHYNIDAVTIISSSARHVTPYGLYNAQFTDWLDHGKSLAISGYATLPLNGDYYEISSVQGLKDLLGFAEVPAYKFLLTADLDLTNIKDASGTTSDWHIPIFSASEFDGGGHTLTNLNVNQAGNSRIGFMGVLSAGSTLQNIGLTLVNVYGKKSVGGLVGLNNGGRITDTYVTGFTSVADPYAVSGGLSSYYVGGLVGYNSGNITDSHADATVGAQNQNSYYTGGLVGYNSGTITNSYATGAVYSGFATHIVGGLVGDNTSGTITDSYATGAVEGWEYVGGLVGRNSGNIIITGSYSTGNVTANKYFGGLIGSGYDSGITNSHYNIDEVLINDALCVTPYGLYNALYADWFADKFLNITEYFSESGGYYLISGTDDLKNLLGFADVPAYKFLLMNNIDLITIPSWYIPVFSGTAFDGGGFILDNLTVTQPENNNIGFIGTLVAGSTLSNIGLTNVSVTGKNYVGGLIGNKSTSAVTSITNAYATGAVSSAYSSAQYVGGLIGYANSNTAVTNSHAAVTVNSGSSGSYVGGLIGYSNGPITNSYATGLVQGGGYVGGLIGYNSNGTITNSYATGAVQGSKSYVGGLIGQNWSTITNSYATGAVQGSSSSSYVGGLIGQNYGSISNSYATGAVQGSSYVGGLIGQNYSSISNAYAGGAVQGSSYVGGLIGHSGISVINYAYATGLVNNGVEGTYVGGLVGYKSGGSAANSFWDTVTTGQDASALGTGKTTAEMKTLATYTGWNIDDAGSTGKVWRIYEDDTYPLLRNFLTPLTITANTVSKAYDGTAYAGGLSGTVYTPESPDMAHLFDISTAYDTFIDVGTYTPSPYSDQQGYDITLTGGTLTINPASVSFTGTRVYDGSTYFAASTFGTGGTISTVVGETLILTGAGSVASKTVAAGSQTVTLGTLALTDGTGYASNYTFTGGTQTATVTPLALTGSIASGSSVYGAALVPGAASFSNAVTGDDIAAAVTVNTAGLTSTSGHLIAGTHTGIQSASLLTGADAGNYTFAGFTGNYTITPLALAGSIATGSSIYGNPLSPGAASFSNAVAGDDIAATVTLNTAGLTSTSGHLIAGTHAGIESASALTGVDAGNYTFAGFTGNYTVTPLSLTGAAIAAGSSTYGSALTPGAVSFGNVVAGDIVTSTAVVDTSTLSTSGNPVVGTYTQTAGSISGTDAANYSFAGFISAANYTINPRDLTVRATAASKLFDGTPLANVRLSDDRVVNDSLTIVYDSALFNDKMPGANKPVMVAGIDVTGTDAANYTLMNTATETTASILAETPLHVPTKPPSQANPSYTPPSDLYTVSSDIKTP